MNKPQEGGQIRHMGTIRAVLDERTPQVCREADGAVGTVPHTTGDDEEPCRCVAEVIYGSPAWVLNGLRDMLSDGPAAPYLDRDVMDEAVALIAALVEKEEPDPKEWLRMQYGWALERWAKESKRIGPLWGLLEHYDAVLSDLGIPNASNPTDKTEESR